MAFAQGVAIGWLIVITFLLIILVGKVLGYIGGYRTKCHQKEHIAYDVEAAIRGLDDDPRVQKELELMASRIDLREMFRQVDARRESEAVGQLNGSKEKRWRVLKEEKN